jgi:hypothetical protein
VCPAAASLPRSRARLASRPRLTSRRVGWGKTLPHRERKKTRAWRDVADARLETPPTARRATVSRR